MTAGPVKIKELLFIVVVLAAAATLGVMAFWKTLNPYGDNSPNFPDGIFYVCEGCGEEFVLTVEELGLHHQEHWGEPVPCPKCSGTKTPRAERCPHCRRMFPVVKMRGKPVICPYCKKTVRRPPSR